MIHVVVDFHAFEAALGKLTVALDHRIAQGFESTLESIAARAKQTTKFVDRTGALRNSIQSNGVSGTAGDLVGIVSYAATSKEGYFYGEALEFGSSRGIKERRFIRDAVEAENGDLLEGSMRLAFQDSGFQVGG